MHRGANKKNGAFHWTRILFSLISIKLTFSVFGEKPDFGSSSEGQNLNQLGFTIHGFHPRFCMI